MGTLFGRHFWMIRLLGIATASAMAGSAASSALAFVIVDATTSILQPTVADAGEDDDALDDEPEVLASQARPVAPVAAAGGPSFGHRAARATLEGYNPFCPSCQPEGAAAPVVLAQGPAGPLPAATIATRLPLRLHATMEAERSEHSLATIFDVERGIVGVYAAGDVVRPGASVVSVQQGRVALRTASGIELLELGAPPPPAVATTAKTEDEPKAKPVAEAPGLDAITCSGADECVVERAFVDEILANPAKFAAQAPRVVPVPEGGFRIAGVRSGSLAKKLGLANGDVLLAVNGQELRGLDDALGLMTKLKRATNLEVTLDRKGKAVRKRIEIR